MGFDNDFNLNISDKLTRRNRVKLMGNAVCPPVMRAIIRNLLVDGR